jgi:hypothetical protein
VVVIPVATLPALLHYAAACGGVGGRQGLRGREQGPVGARGSTCVARGDTGL